MLIIICVCQEKDERPPCDGVNRTETYFDSSTVECAIQLCPEQLKYGELSLAIIVLFWDAVSLSHFCLWIIRWTDFQCIFPEAPSSGMTVVTVTQKTQNDMTSWCFAVDQEREEMLIKVNSWCKFNQSSLFQCVLADLSTATCLSFVSSTKLIL